MPSRRSHDHVAAGGEIEMLCAQEQIVEVDRPIAHAEAQRGRSGFCGPAIGRCRDNPAPRRRHRRDPCASSCSDRCARRSASVGERLAVGGATRALEQDFAVPLEAERFERAQHLVGATRHDARSIEILDAHQPARAMRARVEIAADRRQQRTRGAGGRWERARISPRALVRRSRPTTENAALKGRRP